MFNKMYKEGMMSMKLSVRNFAKIESADIDMNGLTIIAGENNTGKSTIGKIMYSLFTSFHDLDGKVNRERSKGIVQVLYRDYISRKLASMTDLIKILDELFSLPNYEKNEIMTYFNNKKIDSLSESSIDELLTYLKFDTQELENLVVKNIFYDEFHNEVLPKMLTTKKTNITLYIKEEKIELDFDETACNVKHKISLHNDGIYIDNPLIIDNIYIRDESIYPFDLLIENHKHDRFNHDIQLIGKLSQSLTQKASLIDEATYKKRIATILDKFKETVNGDFIEKEDRFTFSNKKTNQEFELSNLSTGIKAFAILMKLIENRDIKDYTCIVLDEPEVHLHPKWQLIYAELLILLQKEFSLNIILTTHSPYFVNAIEVFSRKHQILDKCTYYLAEEKEENAVFKDVTNDPELIYKKLAEPFKILKEEEDRLHEDSL